MLLVLAVVVVHALVRGLLLQVYSIPSASMEPLLEPGDRVLVLVPHGEPERGDVVVFDGRGVFSFEPEPPPAVAAGQQVASWLGFPVGGHHFVKRVIGVGGDRVTCCDEQGRLLVDGLPLDEDYLYPGDLPSEREFDVVVPDGALWVMGDHRSDSADSRAHLGDPRGGMVPVDQVAGRMVAVVGLPGTMPGAGAHGAAGRYEGAQR